MKWLFLVVGYISFFTQANSQDTIRLSLSEILKIAEANYPKLKSNSYELEASKSDIKLQQQTIIPQLDAAYQANLATENNISGMFFPQYVLPITGQISSANKYSPVTGSAASLLFQWQPGIFGDRKSNINLAIAASQSLQSQNDQEIFTHKTKVCDLYLDVIYFQKLLTLYEENIHISENELQQVNVLALAGLRPGIDTALIQAQLSQSRIEWLKINNSFANALSSVSVSLASDSIIINKDTLFYSSLPQQQPTETIEHPFIKTARLSIEESNVKSISISKLNALHFSLWATTFARGSGIDYNGTVKTFDGFNLNRFNYGIGAQLSVPLLKHAEIKTRLQQQSWITKSQQEKLNQISWELKEQKRLSETTLANAISIARETPLQVHSSEYAFKTMQIRYTTGLVNYTELLETQLGLLKAKIELVKSQNEMWKALLFKAAVYGDLNLFINQVE